MGSTHENAAVRRALGKKVGRKPAFSVNDVVDAALAEGLDRFTMAAVAERCNVVTAAIYRVFDSREDIVVACLDRAASQIVLPARGMSWEVVLRLWANECWRLCDLFPGLHRVVYDHPVSVTRIEHVLTAYAAALASSEKTRGQAMLALDLIGDTVFSSRLGVQSWRDIDESGRRGIDRVAGSVDAGSIIAPREHWLARGLLDTKVDVIVAGLTHHWPEV